MRENNHRRLSYVLLSGRFPVHQVMYAIQMQSLFKDCKSWFDEGYNTSGVYTISPDEQTPFGVIEGNILQIYNWGEPE